MKFSVTIPTYKSQYLAEAIESVLSQSYTDFELIIVNDHSPENIDEIVSKFCDERIRYFVNERNCGAEHVVDNWNICLSYARGEYVICMGDDDKLLPNCLEEYSKLIDKYPRLAVYHGWTEIIDENSNLKLMQEARPENESVFSAIYSRWKLRRLGFIGDYLFHTETLKNDGGFYYLPMAWGSDDLTAFIAASHEGVANTQVPVFQYRINSQTLSNSGNVILKMKSISDYYRRCEKLLQESAAKTDIDYCFRQMAIDEIKNSELKKKCLTVSADMQRIGVAVGFFKWYRSRKRYDIPFPSIIYATLEAIKQRYRRKYTM